MNAGAAGAALAVSTTNRMDATGDEHFKGTLQANRDKATKRAAELKAQKDAASGFESKDRARGRIQM